jgi:hypothetical protein
VIFKLVYGMEPNEVDHINGDTGDNRLANLRSVDHAINGRNARLSSSNRSGCAGVRWHPPSNKWESRIGVNHKLISLGCHDTFEGAVQARKAAEEQYGFHRNHGRRTGKRDVPETVQKLMGFLGREG